MPLNIIGFFLFVGSAATSWHWLYQFLLPSFGTYAAHAGGAIGVLLCAAQFAMVKVAVKHWPAALIVGCLMATSISMSYLTLDQSIGAETGYTSSQIGRKADEVADIQAEIELTMNDVRSLSAMEHYTNHGRDKLSARLKHLRMAKKQANDELTEMEGQQMSGWLERFGWLVFLVYSILVDVAGAACLAYSNQLDSQKDELDSNSMEPVELDSELDQLHRELDLWASEGVVPPSVVAKLMYDGTLTVSLDAIRKQFRCSNDDARAVMDALVDAGKITKSGNKIARYSLVA